MHASGRKGIVLVMIWVSTVRLLKVQVSAGSGWDVRAKMYARGGDIQVPRISELLSCGPWCWGQRSSRDSARACRGFNACVDAQTCLQSPACED